MINPTPSKRNLLSSQFLLKMGENPAFLVTDEFWLEFFSDVYKGIKYTQTSGTTAQRPTKDLFPGRFYFDKSLGANGKPIWIGADGSSWVLADGTAA
jgi:hypothetical protein